MMNLLIVKAGINNEMSNLEAKLNRGGVYE